MAFNVDACVPRILRFNDLIKISSFKLCYMPRTNFDEIILPHVFASFRAVVYGSVFIVLWIFNNVEEILSSLMEKILRLKSRLIPSQIIF